MWRHLPLVFLAFALCHVAQAAETDTEALARATAAVEAATPRAQADPSHPLFHITAPAQWINDPNGPIFYQGWYHVFYQLNPYSDGDGPKHWGHVRSRDLVTWEHLPIALAPSNDRGEEAIWSGCCTINGKGQPMIFYTSIAKGKSAYDQASQWAAMGDGDLVHWTKPGINPVLPESLNGNTKIYDWRDPFVFRKGKQTFLVTGGHLGRERKAAVTIYEAANPELTRWTYRGQMFQHPDPKAPTVECPNFFQLGKQWVLFVSPYGKVEYFVGGFDPETCRFTALNRALLDYGSSFYAPNTMQVPDGRRIVWGWVNGFPGGRGWNGCLSLPRELSFSRDGQLRQTPAPQLRKLRGAEVKWPGTLSDQGMPVFHLPATNTVEIHAELNWPARNGFVLEIKGQVPDASPVRIQLDDASITVMDSKAPLFIPGKGKLDLRIFIDRCVLEVFANDTVCFTKVIPTMDCDPTLTVQAPGGPPKINELQAWPLRSIW